MDDDMGLLAKLGGLLQSTLGSGRELPVQQRVGKRGEEEAVRYLKRHGYTILERNFRITGGEIDVVAFRDGMLAFVEVRTRTGPAQFDPLESIGKRKQGRIIKAAQAYAKYHGVEREGIGMRFDVVTVLLSAAGDATEVKHIPSAFEL